MKNLKKLFLLITFLFIASCSSSEDSNTSIVLAVTGSIDTSALLNLQGNDATALVTLNGLPAGNYVSEASIDDEVSYKINTNSSNIEVVILDFFYTSGNRELWEKGIQIAVDTQSSPRVASLKVLSGAIGDEVKFGFTFALKINGIVDLNTIYIVDPKIKIRS